MYNTCACLNSSHLSDCQQCLKRTLEIVSILLDIHKTSMKKEQHQLQITLTLPVSCQYTCSLQCTCTCNCFLPGKHPGTIMFPHLHVTEYSSYIHTAFMQVWILVNARVHTCTCTCTCINSIRWKAHVTYRDCMHVHTCRTLYTNVLVWFYFADGVGDVLEDIPTFQFGLVAGLHDGLPPTNVVHELMKPGVLW